MNLTLHVEKFDDILEEVRPMLQAHSNEIDANMDVLVLDVDEDYYRMAEAGGIYYIYTARVDGVLIGYTAFTVLSNPHYKNSIFAVNDVLFLTPEHRTGKVGATLVMFAEQILKEEHNVKVITYHSKVKHDISSFLNKLGYEREEYTLSKVV